MSESDTPEEKNISVNPDETPETAPAAESESNADPNGPVNEDYTDSDIELGVVKKFVLGSFAVCLLFFVIMLGVHRMYRGSNIEEKGVATSEERQIPGEDDALLQTLPLEDKAEYLAHEAALLNTKTNAGVHAVIPVESAKQLMLEEGFPHSQVAETEPVPEAADEAPVAVETVVAANATPEVAAPAAPMAAAPVAEAPKLDPEMVAAGKVIWETQCMAACHTGKRGAIAPNIHKAFGTMRKLEGGEEILMDTAYVLNSMNNPNEHIARGYMPVMMSFKQNLTDLQKEQVAAYLQSMGKPIPVPVVAAPAVESAPATVTDPAPEAAEPTAPVVVETAPVAEPPSPAAVAPEVPAATPSVPVEAPAAVPAVPVPVPAPPAAPTPVPVTPPPGTIFV